MASVVRLALCCITFALSACSPSFPDKAGLRQLAEAFEEANQADSINAMLDLYHLEGTDAITRQLLKPVLQSELGLPIRTIQFEPLSGAPEENIGFEYEGRSYGPSLEPKLRMRVIYETEDNFISLFSIGQRTDGAWRIVSSRRID
ncbi:MAG: hypothetical protein AAF065_09600 [Verrucomicrobiota bacterium]